MNHRRWSHTGAVACVSTLGCVASAQAGPFVSGASGLVDFGLTIATPIAVLALFGLGIAALVGKISWGWVVGAILGIATIFGAPQIIDWVRGMFAV